MKRSIRFFNPCVIIMVLLISAFFVGCSPEKPTGVFATDGDYADKIVVTWNEERVPEGKNPVTAYYKVFRAEVAEGPYEEISEEIEGTSFDDETVSADRYYYYQVVGFNNLGLESDPSDYDAGYAGNTNALFLQKCLAAETSAIGKLDEKNPSTSIGTKVTIYGDISGSCKKVISNYLLFWKKTEYSYVNYQDTTTNGIIFNGTLVSITGLDDNGFVQGKIDISGDHQGYVDYDLDITILLRSGGGYWVSQDNRPEEWFAWYPYKPDGSPSADIEDQQTAQNLLYAAYCGIAYDRNNTIYGMMAEDIVDLLESLAMDIIMEDEELIAKAVRMLLGVKTTFEMVKSNGTFSLAMTPAGAGASSRFTAEISLDFNDVGYRVGYLPDCKYYYGNSGSVDLGGSFAGYYSVDIENLDISILFSTVNLKLNDGLRVSHTYPYDFEVNYNQYNISFGVNYGPNDPINPQQEPLNVKIVPQIGSVPDIPDVDNRDYTIGGGFTISIMDSEDTITFGEGFNYIQNQIDSDLFVNINGLLGVTGLDGLVLIETDGDIALDQDGGWTSGSLMMTGVTTSNSVTFSDDGSAQFSGDLGEWTVLDWQEDLSPF